MNKEEIYLIENRDCLIILLHGSVLIMICLGSIELDLEVNHTKEYFRKRCNMANDCL